MTTTDLATVAQQEWGGSQTPQHAQEGIQTLPLSVFKAVQEGGDVEAILIAPEDQWTDVPKVEQGLERLMIENQQPIAVLAMKPTEGEFGPCWFYVFDLEGQLFHGFVSRNVNDTTGTHAKIAMVLEAGARSVKNVILTETDTGKPQPWKHLIAVPPTHRSKIAKPGAAKHGK